MKREDGLTGVHHSIVILGDRAFDKFPLKNSKIVADATAGIVAEARVQFERNVFYHDPSVLKSPILGRLEISK